MLQPPSITVIDYNGNRTFGIQNISRTIQSSCFATWSTSKHIENSSKASVKLVFDFMAHRGHA
jgi:hypothetical protein